MNNLLDHWIDGNRYETLIWYSTSDSSMKTYFYDLANNEYIPIKIKNDLEIVEFEDPEYSKMFE